MAKIQLDLLSGEDQQFVQKGERKAGERMTLKIKDVEYAFRWCPAGTFAMGSPASVEGRKEDETPHQVTLSRGFWMLETETTQAMWESVMGDNPSHFKGAKLPVEMVSWDDCQEYITKLNAHLAGTPGAPAGFKFSLPTETQWEYACRAGTTTAYHFGNTLTKVQANFENDKSTDVGSYPANAWSLRDMHGNVWEWCADWYGDYPGGAVTDPTGASTDSCRVVRGGGWNGFAEVCRSASRGIYVPSHRRHILGLRLALVSETQVEDTPPTPTPTPTPQPPSENIDPKIIGSWTYREYNYGDYGFNGTYTYQFKADGTFIQTKSGLNKSGGYSFSINTIINGKYTTSGGVVYLTDLVYSYYLGGDKKTEPLKNKSSTYKIGTDTQHDRDYLEIRIFTGSNTIPDSDGLRKFYK